jgi:hypothetical protein
MLDQSLWDECADWIAEQMEEENMLVDPALISLVLEVEREHAGDRAASLETARAIEGSLQERGVAGVPDTIDARLLFSILQWEDEFLGLAGKPRPA